MSTGMVVAGTAVRPAVDMLEFVKVIGSDIAKSQMFGAETEAQGRVLALSCFVSGRDPLGLQMEYHLMKGKLTLKAENMLGRLVRDGGNYEIVEHSPNAAEIRLECHGRKFHERFTWEEAQGEPFIYSGKTEVVMKALKDGNRESLTFKDNYATPRRRMQQLWARVVSDGVRVVAPHLLGVYTPEETADYSGIALSPDVASQSSDTVIVDSKVYDSPVDDVVESVVVEAVAEKQVVVKVEAASNPGLQPATAEQVAEIQSLFSTLNMSPATQQGCLNKRDVTHIEELNQIKAADLISGLNGRLAKMAESNPSEKGMATVDANGPITQELYDSVIKEFKSAAQRNSELVKSVHARLLEAGLKLSELTYSQGRKLLQSLKSDADKAFFELTLMKEVTQEPGDV